MNSDLDSDRTEMIKWFSNHQSHIPMSEVEFLIGVPPFDTEEDDEPWNDDDW